MRRISFLYILVVVILLAGCGKREEVKNYTASLKYIWEPQNYYPAYAMSSVNYEENSIVFPRRVDQTLVFVFADLKDGSDIRTITVPGGDGPGQIIGFQAIDVRDGKVAIFDPGKAKICLYDTAGKFIDDYFLDTEIGLPMTSTTHEGYLYVNGKIKNKLVKFDLKNNKIVKSLTYDQFKDVPENGDTFQGGLVQFDPFSKTLFLGYYAKPFRLEQYDTDLNLIRTYTSDTFDEHSLCQWCITKSNLITQDGDRIIAGITFDEKYIYASYGGGYEYTGDESGNGKTFNYREAPVKVMAFRRSDNSFVGTITIDKIPEIQGFIRLLHADTEKLVFQFSDKSGSVDKAMGRPRPEDSFRTFAIATTDNPLY